MSLVIVEVHSFSVALWLYAKGHRPVDAAIAPNERLVFAFPRAAQADFQLYNEAKEALNTLEFNARSRVLSQPSAEVPR